MKAIAVFALAAPVSAAILGQKAFLGNGMQPEVVARTLSNVEDEWKAQAAVFAECNSTSGLEGTTIVDCADAPTSFGKSCGTVVSAIIQGSGGDRDVAKEYMADVCAEAKGAAEKEQCTEFSAGVEGFMTDDVEINRDELKFEKFCQTFWNTGVKKIAKVAADKLDAVDAKRAKEDEIISKARQQEQESAEEEDNRKELETDLQVAQNLTESATDDAQHINEAVKDTEVEMTADDDEAMKFAERARMALQTAGEKEAAGVENAKSEEQINDEAEAKAAGDALAERIARRAAKRAAALSVKVVTNSSSAAVQSNATTAAEPINSNATKSDGNATATDATHSQKKAATSNATKAASSNATKA